MAASDRYSIQRVAWLACVLVAAFPLAGCAGFSQVYHSQSAPTADGVPNFFRVKVDGDAQAARARFLVRFYDERAVDLYFNEVKNGYGEVRRIFEDNQKEPGAANSVVKPLTPYGARVAS